MYCVTTEKSTAKEVKQFYTEHSTDVFYVVYGSFTTLETTIHDKCKTPPGPGRLPPSSYYMCVLLQW